jgi:hypothetical protein
MWLRSGDLKAMLPPKTMPQYMGKQTINGEACDFLKAVIPGQYGESIVEFDVAPSGLLSRYYYLSRGPMGQKQYEWVFKSYKPLRTLSASRFENRIPDDFMPYGLPDRHLPTGVGKKANLSGWVYGDAGTKWTAPKGQPLLFVITSRNSTPSKGALAALGSWRAELNNKHVVVAEASDAASSGAAGGLLYNPGQHALQSMDLPATPMFYLLDSKGMVRNMWMGFSAGGSAKLHSQIVQAVAALK